MNYHIVYLTHPLILTILIYLPSSCTDEVFGYKTNWISQMPGFHKPAFTNVVTLMIL